MDHGDAVPSVTQTTAQRRSSTTEPPITAPPTLASPTTTQTSVVAASEGTPSDDATEVVEVVSRAGWGATQARSGLVEHTPVTLTVHHSAVEQTDLEQGPARVRQHQTYHQSLGWPDLAYHFVVDRAGVAYEGRGAQWRGDTGTEYDPDGHFLVCMEGDFDVQQPSPAQVETTVQLFAWASVEFDIDPATIAGHNAYASTSCPGVAVDAIVPSLGERIAATAPVLLSMVGGA